MRVRPAGVATVGRLTPSHEQGFASEQPMPVVAVKSYGAGTTSRSPLLRSANTRMNGLSSLVVDVSHAAGTVKTLAGTSRDGCRSHTLMSTDLTRLVRLRTLPVSASVTVS